MCQRKGPPKCCPVCFGLVLGLAVSGIFDCSFKVSSIFVKVFWFFFCGCLGYPSFCFAALAWLASRSSPCWPSVWRFPAFLVAVSRFPAFLFEFFAFFRFVLSCWALGFLREFSSRTDTWPVRDKNSLKFSRRSQKFRRKTRWDKIFLWRIDAEVNFHSSRGHRCVNDLTI